MTQAPFTDPAASGAFELDELRKSGARYIYKIAEATGDASWRAHDPWPGSADDLRDGYIHASEAPQVSRTLRKFFGEARTDLELLALDTARLDTATFRREALHGGSTYPHVYAPLAHDAVVARWALVWRGDRYMADAIDDAIDNAAG